jgi:uncharacterized membrane protein (DUF373 family)
VSDQDRTSDAALDRSSIDVPYTGVHRMVRRFIEPALDTVVVLLAVALLGVMLRSLLSLGAHVLAPGPSFALVVAEALFLLVLVELQRLVVIYLRDHHVSVDVMIETVIVATLREVLLLGITEMAPVRLLTISVFVLALGVLLRFGDLRTPGRAARRRSRPRAGPAGS